MYKTNLNDTQEKFKWENWIIKIIGMLGGFPELHVFKNVYSCLTGAPDNRGTEFVIGYMENNGVTINVELFVTTSRTTKVSVTVDSPKCTSPRVSSSFTVTAGQVKQLFISPSIR